MGCGKSKHAVATATAPTAVARKKVSAEKQSSTTKKEAVTPTANGSANQEITGNENAVVVTPADEAKQGVDGELISRESPVRFFSSRKDEEFVAGSSGDGKSDCDGSEYASPRTESTGRENSFNQRNATDGKEVEVVGKDQKDDMK